MPTAPPSEKSHDIGSPHLEMIEQRPKRRRESGNAASPFEIVYGTAIVNEQSHRRRTPKFEFSSLLAALTWRLATLACHSRGLPCICNV
jgi:hypothetical protein